MSRRFQTCVLTVAMMLAGSAHACWDEVGARYQINPLLLAAIAKTESSFNPRVRTQNSDSSYDIGMMGINSSHLPMLAKFGISEQNLYDPCTNIAVGAYLLRKHQLQRGNTWDAVGSYHSKTPSLKWAYAQRVSKNLNSLMAGIPR